MKRLAPVPPVAAKRYTRLVCTNPRYGEWSIVVEEDRARRAADAIIARDRETTVRLEPMGEG